MKISVIIPVYNVAPYLAKCLDSVINQTFTDLQIIVVDDGSTDEGGKICDEYAAKDKRIEVYHRKNEGLSAALNFGLSVVKGEYIGQVDSDDALHPKMYEILYNTMKEKDADLVSCKWSYSLNRVEKVNVSNYDIFEINPITEYQRFRSEIQVFRWDKLYKAKLFEGFQYPVGHVYEDEYIHRIAFASKKCVLVDLPLYYYRLRDLSFMHSFDEKRVYDSFHAFDDWVNFAFDNNWSESFSFVASEYCYRAMWIWNLCKEYKVNNRKVKNLCRKKVRDFLSNNPNIEVPRRYWIWATNIFLWYLYAAYIFLFRWERRERKPLRKKVDFLIKLGFIPKIKNASDDVIVSIATDDVGYETVHYSLYSVFRQTRKPDKVILWIPEDDFTEEDVKNNKVLSKFLKKGLTVKFYKYREAGSSRTFAPVFRDFPDSQIFVLEERWFPSKKWLQKKIEV